VSFTDPLVKLKLVSGVEWPITLSDVMLSLAILLLLHEVIKGARPGGKYLTDHLLSLSVFGASAAEFVLWPKFGTSTYFLLVLLAMVDFFSGVALRVRRGAKAQATPRGAATRPATKEPEAPREVPHVEPVPVPAAVETPAVTTLETVPVSHPEPKVVPPSASEPPPVIVTAPPTPTPLIEPPPVAEAEPQISSPELQSENGTPAAPEAPHR
jgi:hypothetical protein